MSKAISDGMKTAMYQKMIESGNWNPSSIIKYFKGADYVKAGIKHAGTGKRSAFSMRKTDALTVMRELKRTGIERDAFIERNRESNMSMNTQVRIAKDMEKTARKEALFVAQKRSTLKSRRAKIKGKEVETIQDARDRTYKNVDASQDYVEFYG